MKSNEFQLIQSIQHRIPRSLQGVLGIGDDADALRPSGRYLWISTDAVVEGVDFIYSRTAPEAVGHKALAVNLSDLAAMGAEPLGLVVTLGLPRKVTQRWVERFYDGLLKLAKRYRVPCLGGDLSSSKEFFACVTVLGKTKGKGVLRSGARPGQAIAVTGKLGGSILRHHLNFEPRLRESQFLARFRPASMIDLSDGLVQDLGHILKASRVGARLWQDRIPVSRAALRLAKGQRKKALIHALTDGEDFELLFTISKANQRELERVWKKQFPRVSLSWIGETTSKAGKIEWFENVGAIHGETVPLRRHESPLRLSRSGFLHF